MTTTGDAALDPEPPRLDRDVLVSNVISGGLWLSPLALFGSLGLLLIGAMYVAAASVFLAAVYAQQGLTWRQEALAWAAPWLVAAVLWAGILIGISFENSVSHYLLSLGFGFVLATACCLAWQIAALAIRQFLGWQSARTGAQARPAAGARWRG